MTAPKHNRKGNCWSNEKRGTLEEQLRDGQPLRGRVCKAIGYRLTKRTTDEQIVEAVERFAARRRKGAR